MLKKKKELETNMEMTEKRLNNAEKLITLTSDEAERWKITVETMEVEIENLFGDIFLSCSAISYNGPFTGDFRKVFFIIIINIFIRNY